MKRTKSVSYCFLVVLCVTLLFSNIKIQSAEELLPVELVSKELTKSQITYDEHAPIIITSNADFTAQGFPGDGTLASPYVIQNYNITTHLDSITISNVDVHFIIQNCHLTGGGGGSGVRMTNVANGVVRNNNITLKSNSLYLISSSDNILANNTILGYNVALVLESSSNNLLVNNTITKCLERSVILDHSSGNILKNNKINSSHYFESIYLYQSPNNQFSGNVMENNGFGLRGFNSLEHWHQNITSDNLINGKPVGYFWNRTAIAIEGSQYSQLILANCTRISIVDTSYNDTFWGIMLGYSSQCTLRNISLLPNTIGGIHLEYSMNNTMMNSIISGVSTAGLYLRYSSNNNLVNNTISGCIKGVYFERSMNNNFTRNIIIENREYGVIVDDSSDNTIENNTISRNGSGLLLNSPWFHSKVVNNTITDNERQGIEINGENNEVVNNIITGSEEGVRFFGYSSNNKIVNNTISGSEYGIRFYPHSDNNEVANNSIFGSSLYGIYCSSGTVDNLLYLNVFTSNDGLDAQDDGSGNHWNISGIGNYWSDYSGSGAYYIPGTAGSIDYHPHMYSDTILPVIDSPANVEYNETSSIIIMWNPVDSHPLYYAIYQNGTEVVSGDWDGGPITILITGLDPGIYNYTIVVRDCYTNWVSDDVIVTVLAVDYGFSLDLLGLMLAGIGLGAVFVIIIMFEKRR